MTVKIRLSRLGAKKRPCYRIVVANSHSPRDGKFIEKIGSYNPILKVESNAKVKLLEERARYWISVGAKPTKRVKILIKNNLYPSSSIK